MNAPRKRLARLAATRPLAIGRLLLLARRDFVTRVSRCMRQRGLPEFPSTFLTLLPYIDTDGTRSTDLAQRAGISKQAVGKIVREYEEAGLLERLDDPLDARASLVRLTDEGLRLLLLTHRAIDDVEKEYERLLGAQSMASFRAALQRVAYADAPVPDAQQEAAAPPVASARRRYSKPVD